MRSKLKRKTVPSINTPLANLYQRWVDQGLIVPAQTVGEFSYPSVLVHVPCITTTGVSTLAGMRVDSLGRLEFDTRRNPE
jgi:hypothetical protein